MLGLLAHVKYIKKQKVGDLMKDYQQGRMKSYVLPEAVYRQALWAVKDLPRLKRSLELYLYKEGNLPSGSLVMERIGERNASEKDFTGQEAIKKAMLSMKIQAIEDAFFQIPYEYREGIRLKLTEGKEYGDDFHANTWKKWQQIFIFHVAKNLSLY